MNNELKELLIEKAAREIYFCHDDVWEVSSPEKKNLAILKAKKCYEIFKPYLEKVSNE